MSDSALFGTTYAALCLVGTVCLLGALRVLFLVRKRKMKALPGTLLYLLVLCLPPAAGFLSIWVGRWSANEYGNYGFFGEPTWILMALLPFYGSLMILGVITFLVTLYARPDVIEV